MRHALRAASLALRTSMQVGRAPMRSAARRVFAWLDGRRERSNARALPETLDARV